MYIILHIYLLAPPLQPVVVQTAEDHDGLERMLVDNLLTQQQCEGLIELAKVRKTIYMCTYIEVVVFTLTRS